MKSPASGLPGKTFTRGVLLSCALAAAGLVWPSLAGAQAPAQPLPPPPDAGTSAPPDTSTQAPPNGTQQTPQQTPLPTTQAPSTTQVPPTGSKPGNATTTGNSAPKDVPPIPQQDNPKVKAGSEDDVNSIGNRDVGKGVNFYSIEKEIALGKSLAQEVERSSKLVDDPVVSEYVNRVGQNLVRNSDARVPFTIKVIDSDEVNAFALPGGFFYVNSGLILRAQEESELAGVMAHEISHVTARHGTKNQTKGDLMQLGMIPLMILLPGGWAGYGIYEGLQFAIPISFLKFSRDDERQADYYGLQYTYKAGYDPNAYITFFERILADEKRQPGTVSKFFSDHPPTGERITNSEKEIEK